MTARKHPPKPHGRCQERKSKDKLLELLMKRGPLTVSQLSRLTGLTHKCARGHLENMREYGEVFKAANVYPAIWSHTPFAIIELERAQAEEDAGLFVHVHKPAGTWEHGHSIPPIPPSIFAMGGTA